MITQKDSEYRCYKLTQEYIDTCMNLRSKKYIRSVFPVSSDVMPTKNERPDFIIDCDTVSYAIEHFMVDFCNDGIKNNQSQSMLASKDISGIFHKYHDAEIGTINDSDMESAVSEIEAGVNKISNIAMTFDYDKYVGAFTRTFNHHYKKIVEYKNNKEIKNERIKMGFIIEFHCDTHLMHAVWNDSVVYFSSGQNSFPLTKDIMMLIEKATDLDFVIVSQFNEGIFTEASDVKLYEPSSMKRSLEQQRIKVYDSIFYSKIRKNISLNLERKSIE